MIDSPSRTTSTVHFSLTSSYAARAQVVEDQYGISIILVYDSSQSPNLSFGEKTGQFSGNLMYGMWSYQTGSCRHNDLYRFRHWSPGRGCLSITTKGTPSCRNRAPRPIPPWPPPTTSTNGCSLEPITWASCSRVSFQVKRLRTAPWSAPRGRRSPRFSSYPFNSSKVVKRVHALSSLIRPKPDPRPTAVSNVNQTSVTPSAVEDSVTKKFRGCTCAAVASTNWAISSRPSTVVRFHVKETKSRQ